MNLPISGGSWDWSCRASCSLCGASIPASMINAVGATNNNHVHVSYLAAHVLARSIMMVFENCVQIV